MKLFTSRVIFSIGAFIFFLAPFSHLAKLSNDIRNFGFIDFFIKADSEFPLISALLWRLGPLAWWSYLTPFFIAIGISFRIQYPIKSSLLLISFLAVAMNTLITISAFVPYGNLYKVVGFSIANSSDYQALMVNIGAVLSSFMFCSISIRKSLRVVN
jgi:hypothetical protein